MEKITRQLIVSYHPQQMYQLVDDIKAYPEFLPWCTDAVEHYRTADKVEASISLGLKGMAYDFTTSNILVPNEKITLDLVSGPFKRLVGYWEFKNLADIGCKVSLNLEFEFSSTLVSLAFGSVFRQASETLIDAFYQRACEVYGTPTTV